MQYMRNTTLMMLILLALVSITFGQLSDTDIAALQIQGELEGWTFTIAKNSATERSIDELCGLVEPEDWWIDARFDACKPRLGLPTYFDWRDSDGCTPIKDQGACGSCWAFGTVGPLECAIKIKDAVEEDLSEQWLLSCNSDGYDCGGGWWAHDYHEWKTDPCGGTGAVLESDFPYVASDVPCGCPYPHYYLIDSWAFIGTSGDVPSVDAIKQAILDYGPVSVAVRVNAAFQGYSGGVFNACESGSINHAVVLVGWDDSQGTNGVWFLRNSWGTDWGEGGYMRIEYGCSSVGYAACYIDYPGSDDLRITPTSGFTSLGPEGGPFTPPCQTYTLTNNGTTSLDWTATWSEAWLEVSPTSGALAVGLSTDVDVCINSSANTLPTGIYTDTITFTNVTSGNSQTRWVTLRVGQPDYFTELFDAGDNDLANQTLTFTPDGSGSFYSACREATTAFPTDPSGGTTLYLGDDDYELVTLTGGAQVSLYGTSYSSFYVGSNGYITFTAGDYEYMESLAHHFAAPRISGLFDDLNPSAGGTISWKQLGDRAAVTFENLPEYGMSNSNSFQIEMFFDGTIRLTHLSIAAADGLVGLSQGLGLPPGFLESDLTAYGPCTPPDNLYITPAGGFSSSGYEGGPFTPACASYTLTNIGSLPLEWTADVIQPWLDVAPSTGTLLSSASTIVDVCLNSNANSLSPNTYTDTITFTNVTSGTTQTRPMTLQVIAAPGEIEVTDSILPADDLDMPFGNVLVGQSRTEQVTVTNTDGTYDLIVTDISLSGGYSEDFNDGLAQGWEELVDTNWQVVSGEYRAAAGTTYVRMQSTYAGEKWLDCSAQVTMRRTGDEGSAAVLVVRASDDFNWFTMSGSAYLIGISGDGYYYVGKYVSGSFSMIQGWTASPYLNTGTAANIVMVSINGTAIDVYFNGDLEWSGTDSSISAIGRLGLLGYSGTSAQTIHYFDNVQVSGVGSLDFRLENLPSLPAIVAPAGFLAFDVVYQPTTVGTHDSSVVIESNDADEPEVELLLSGTGIPDDLGITPADAFLSSGLEGGPFTPPSKTYTLANNGSASLDWTASKTAAWLDLSNTGGTLAPGGSDTVEVSLNSNANSLVPGIYTDPVIFTNTTSSVIQEREARLTVFSGQRVLFFWDQCGAGSDNVTPALTNLGLTDVTTVTDSTDFETQLALGGWNLVIVDSYGSSMPSSSMDALVSYYDSGGRIIFFYWGLFPDYPAHQFLSRAGVTLSGEYTSQEPIYTWIQNPLFDTPNLVPDLTSFGDYCNRDGQYVEPSSAVPYAGYTLTPAVNQSALTVDGEGRLILNAFAPQNFYADQDADGKVDMVELYENEISFLLWGAVDDLKVTPFSGFESSGPEGGPFSPPSKTYTLTNNGSAPLDWTASKTVAWLDLSNTGGTLASGALDTVEVTLNSNADSLPMGIYTDTVTFNNTTSGTSQTRGVTLRVGQPDYFTELFETGDNDLDNQTLVFTPDGSANFYRACREAATTFPTDPAGGTTLYLGDDDYVLVGLSGGAQVSFYGTSYPSFYVGSNGYITFTAGDWEYMESLAQHFYLPRISGLFDDLNPSYSGTVSWKQLADRAVVTFENVPEYSTSNSNNFQIELFFDGVIRLTHLGIGANDGLSGLSEGLGIPTDFAESDLSAYGPCTGPTPIPTCVPIAVDTWTFEPAPDGWTYQTAVPPTGIPAWSHASSVQVSGPGAIGLNAATSETTDYYGSWDNYSGNPSIPAISWVANSVWRAMFTMSANKSDANTVPSIRLRFTENQMKVTSYIQVYPGGWVPLAQRGVSTTDYSLYLRPAVTDNGFFLAFDMVDFGQPYGVACNGTAYLEEVVVDRFDLGDPCFDSYWTAVSSYSGTGLHSWSHSSGGVSYLTDVNSSTKPGDGLEQSTTLAQTRAFGAWNSPGGQVTLVPDQFYRAVWRFACEDSTQVGTIRMRMHTDDFRYASYMALDRDANPANSPLPPTTGKDYYVYADFPGTPTAGYLVLSWDLYDFDPASAGWAKLTQVSISSRD